MMDFYPECGPGAFACTLAIIYSPPHAYRCSHRARPLELVRVTGGIEAPAARALPGSDPIDAG